MAIIMAARIIAGVIGGSSSASAKPASHRHGISVGGVAYRLAAGVKPQHQREKAGSSRRWRRQQWQHLFQSSAL
jgi:hypothetical protein